MRNIDTNKIQSDTKDIVDDGGDNLILGSSLHSSNNNRRITATSPPQIRSTLPNRFSNTGGNGGNLDDIEILSADKNVRKRHRKRQQGQIR